VRTRSRPVALDDRALNIFTDGSSLSGPRRGGLAFTLVTVGPDGHEVVRDFPLSGFEAGTNNQMELKACAEALRFVMGRYSPIRIADFDKVVVYSDSQYVVDGVTRALFDWSRNGWFKRDGNPVRNAVEWQELVAAVKKAGKRVEFKWCKGHSASNTHNKRVDRLAKASARGELRESLHVSRVRRKMTDRTTGLGSIRAEGQRVSIWVVTDELLRKPRMFAYKIEVLSEDSPYFGNVDDYFSEDIMLNAGHAYEVRLNDERQRPRIVENCGEITPTDPV
jgi:ribonuclease HI